jgi:hypothetical protein
MEVCVEGRQTRGSAKVKLRGRGRDRGGGRKILSGVFR